MSIIAAIIFAIVAVIILFQLYSVLGRKSGFRVEDKVLAKPAEDFEGTLKLERPAETPRLPNLELLKSRDVNFNEINFLEKARETYEQVVLAFHKGELDGIKDRLAEKVYTRFAEAVAGRDGPQTRRLSFVDAPKADIDVIDCKDDTAQIRVRFLSELTYEEILPAEIPEAAIAAADEAAEPAAKPKKAAAAKTSKDEKEHKPEKEYRRTAEFWTFQKGMRNPSNPWLLTRVEAAKA